MIPSSSSQNTPWGESTNFPVKEKKFASGEFGIPIAGDYTAGPFSGSAIGEYKIPPSGGSLLGANEGSINWISSAPSSGTYVLGAIDGAIQWIATESCE